MRSSSNRRKEKDDRGSASWKTPLPRLSTQQLLPGRARSDDFWDVEDQSGAGPGQAGKSFNTQSIHSAGSSYGVFSGDDTVTAALPPSSRSPVAPDMATSFYTSATPGDSPRTSSEQIPLSEIHPALRPRPDEDTPVMIPASPARRSFAALPHVTLTANRLDPNVDWDPYGRPSSASSRISIPRTSSRQSITPTNASAASPTFFGVHPGLRLTNASQASLASSASSGTMARRHEGRSRPTQSQIGPPSSPSTSRPSSRGTRTSKYTTSTTPVPFLVDIRRSSAQSMQDNVQRISGERVERLRSTSSPKTPSSPVFETTRETVPQFQYPIIRSPSASSSFAGMSASELPMSHPPRSSAAPSSRASTRKRLSTVLSTVEPVAALEFFMPENLEDPSISQDGQGGLISKDPRLDVEKLRQSYGQPLVLTSGGSATGDVDDIDDVPELQTPSKESSLQRSGSVKRQGEKHSGSLIRAVSASNMQRSKESARRSEATSGSASFPAWARTFYRRSHGVSTSATPRVDSQPELAGSQLRTADSGPTTPGTSHFPSGTSGLSTRPREVNEKSAFLTQPPPLRYLPQPAQRQTWLEDPPVQEPVTLGRESGQWPLRPSRPVTPYTEPHLPPDRKETARWSTWTTPSIDEALGSKSNRQILLFCLGFICPFGKAMGVRW